MKTVALIQARMTSTRLPGKIMADLGGKPLLARVVERVRRAQTLDLVVVATTDRLTDDSVMQFCEVSNTPYFRGDENDVLDRFYRAAKHFGADVIARLTADCPLLDPAVIDRVVRAFHTGEYDYVSNTLVPSYPDGLDTEVFSWRALERAWNEARLPSEREHVTPYIWKHPELFRLGGVKHDVNLSELRWTVDEPRDLELVRRVYAYLANQPDFGMADVLALFQQHPELNEVNAGIERNEGYAKSLADDHMVGEKTT